MTISYYSMKKGIETLLVCMLTCALFNAHAQNRESMMVRIRSMDKETDPEKNIASMFDIIRVFKLDTIKDAEDIDVLKGKVALTFLNAGAYPKFETYIGLIKNKFNQTSFLNMAAYSLFEHKADLDYAAVIAGKTIVLYDSIKSDPSARPSGFPSEDWNRFMKMAVYPYYETYAEILHAKGQDERAFFYEEQALKGIDIEQAMPSSIELYTALLEAIGQKEKAYALLLKMAGSGKSSINMDIQLKRLCIEKMGSETDASIFLDSIRSNVSQIYKSQLAKNMITGRKAPDFNLADLSGKRVTLSDLRGKIVVLDFWATWCAPCIASLPAMKLLKQRHPEVIFLFIATKDKERDVKAYANNKKLSLRILMDTPSIQHPNLFTVASAYELESIPAKVVIDKKGMQRFISTGYLSDAALTNELEAMIAIAEAQ